MGHLAAPALTSANSRFFPFVAATDDTALIEIVPNGGHLVPWVNDTPVTFPTVATTITDGDFAVLTGWTDVSNVEASATVSAGELYLSGYDYDYYAAVRQLITVAGGDQNVEHAIEVTVTVGPVTLWVGSSAGGTEYVEQSLHTGHHFISFTPTGDFYVELRSNLQYEVRVDEIRIASNQTLDLDIPYAAADADRVQIAQSVDKVFVACEGHRPYVVERYGVRSWSWVWYDYYDGPYDRVNTTNTVLSVTDLEGTVLLNASQSFFTSGMVGDVLRIDSRGQIGYSFISSAGGADEFTDSIKVTGTGTQRDVTVVVNGTFTGTVYLQQSVGGTDEWEDVANYTVATSTTYNDSLSNQIVYYRIGVKAALSSGNLTTYVSTPRGTKTGYVRIREYTSAVAAEVDVLKPLGSYEQTEFWYESLWSSKKGYPSSVGFHEGRLWWAGNNYYFGSVSDDYYSFDFDVEGDSGPIIRTIGYGAADNIHWLLPLNLLMAGTSGSVAQARSTLRDEPLTPFNFGLKDADTQGTAAVPPARIDGDGVYSHANGRRLMMLLYDGQVSGYSPEDVSILVPDLLSPGIKRLAVQRQPDTRIHAVLNDGNVAVLLFNKIESVAAWVKIETNGTVNDVAVLPAEAGSADDRVYYSVTRFGSTYLEKVAQESDCVGGALNLQMDAYVTGTGTTITGLDHLNGETVVAWGDGVDLGTFSVSGGSITLPASYTTAVAGLAYTADYVSSKLAYAAAAGTGLTQRKRISQVSLILRNTHHQGVKIGTDANVLDDLPAYEDGAVVAADTIHTDYDAPAIPVNAEWGSDERLRIRAASPRPATVVAAVPTLTTHESL
jgi:hypothetical protein